MILTILTVHADGILQLHQIFASSDAAEEAAARCATFIATSCAKTHGFTPPVEKQNWRETVALTKALLADRHAKYRFDVGIELIATRADLPDGADGFDVSHAIHGALIYHPTYFDDAPIDAEALTDWWRDVRRELAALWAGQPPAPIQ
jgi:hypothetical protein